MFKTLDFSIHYTLEYLHYITLFNPFTFIFVYTPYLTTHDLKFENNKEKYI